MTRISSSRRVAWFAALALGGCGEAPDAIPWPMDSWATSSPEAQGLSSEDLADALAYARSHGLNIHSLTLVRNGVLVLDAYFYPFAPEMRHDLASATKSMVSLLTGIAIADGALTASSQTALSALPPTLQSPIDAQTPQITIAHLLAMQSGFECGGVGGEAELAQMRNQPHWSSFAISLPVTAAPGSVFRYCSPNYHLLSAIISHSTGLAAADYARSRLFGPLGISDVFWPADGDGVNHGWGDLQLRPLDMARVGLMMLKRGRWADQQLVATRWIDESLTARATVNNDEDYGLGWWLSRDLKSLFEANGRGGQRIVVVPEKELVVVMTGGGFEPAEIGHFLLRAIRSDKALPENPAATARLAAEISQASTPPPPQAVTSSATAAAISGQVYDLEHNSLGINWLALDFMPGPQAKLRLGLATDLELVQPLGLDGQYRLTNAMDGAFTAGRAAWLTSQRLAVELNTLSLINRYQMELAFSDDSAVITISEPTSLGTVVLNAVARSATTNALDSDDSR